MRYGLGILVFTVFAVLFAACAGDSKPSTPLNTLKEYGDAFKKKDITTMKLLLSDASLKMAEQEAKAQNVTVDDIVKRETLFNENQMTAEFRNQKIEGEKATIEMKDSMGIWNTVHFVREDGAWKIDKQGMANQMLKDFEERERQFEQNINSGRIP
jgi:hypothetical protein